MSWHCLARRRWSQNLNPGQPDSRACFLNSASCCILHKVCFWTGEPSVKPTFCADLFLGRSSMSCNPFEVALCSWAEGDSLRSSDLAISMLIIAEGTKELCCHSSHIQRLLVPHLLESCGSYLSWSEEHVFTHWLLTSYREAPSVFQILHFLSRGSHEQMAIPLTAPAFFPGLMGPIFCRLTGSQPLY